MNIHIKLPSKTVQIRVGLYFLMCAVKLKKKKISPPLVFFFSTTTFPFYERYTAFTWEAYKHTHNLEK